MNESYKLLQDFTDSVDELFSLFVRWMNPQGKTPTHKHDFIELVIVFSGSGDHEYGGQVIKVQKGDIFVIPRGKYHRYGTCSPDFAVMNILYIPESISMPLLDFTYLPGYEALYLGKCRMTGHVRCFIRRKRTWSRSGSWRWGFSTKVKTARRGICST